VICFVVGHHIDQCCFDGLHEVMVTVDSRLCLHVDNLDLLVMSGSQMCIDRLHVVVGYLHGCSLESGNVDERRDYRPCCLERECFFAVWIFRGLKIVSNYLQFPKCNNSRISLPRIFSPCSVDNARWHVSESRNCTKPYACFNDICASCPYL
jgi:hypothetical protein